MPKHILARSFVYCLTLVGILCITPAEPMVVGKHLPERAKRVHPAVIGKARAKRARPQIGVASWYGKEHQGRLTASGRRFDRRKLTAAHNTLPLNTRAIVTNLENGKSVEVTIDDRGPGIRGRVIDLSEHAARRLGMKKEGLALVKIEPLPETLAFDWRSGG